MTSRASDGLSTRAQQQHKQQHALPADVVAPKATSAPLLHNKPELLTSHTPQEPSEVHISSTKTSTMPSVSTVQPKPPPPLPQVQPQLPPPQEPLQPSLASNQDELLQRLFQKKTNDPRATSTIFSKQPSEGANALAHDSTRQLRGLADGLRAKTASQSAADAIRHDQILQGNGGGSKEGTPKQSDSKSTTASSWPPVLCPVPSPPVHSKKSLATSTSNLATDGVSASEGAAPKERPPSSSSSKMKERRRRPLAFDAIAFFINSTPHGRRYFGENFQVKSNTSVAEGRSNGLLNHL